MILSYYTAGKIKAACKLPVYRSLTNIIEQVHVITDMGLFLYIHKIRWTSCYVWHAAAWSFRCGSCVCILIACCRICCISGTWKRYLQLAVLLPAAFILARYGEHFLLRKLCGVLLFFIADFTKMIDFCKPI